MGGACGMGGEKKSCIPGPGDKHECKRPLGALGVDGRIILKCIFK